MQAQIQALHMGHQNRRHRLDKQSNRLKWLDNEKTSRRGK